MTKISSRIGRIVDHQISNITAVIGLALGAGAAIHTAVNAGKADSTLSELSSAFFIFIISTLIYQAIFLTVLTINTWRAGKYEERLKNVTAQHERVDSAFQELSEERARFDSRLFNYLRVHENGLLDKRDQNQLSKDLEDHLRIICDAAAKTVSARKGGSFQISANIKLLFSDRKDGKVRYFTAARSSDRVSLERQGREASRQSHFLREENSVFSRIMPGGESEIVVSEDLESTLNGQMRNRSEKQSEPDIHALRYYKWFMTVPIYGDPFPETKISLSGKTLASEKLHDDKDIIGFLTIDSHESEFGSGSDQSILEELSVHCYSTINACAYVFDFIDKRDGEDGVL
jgi:hypothetical protein